MSRKQLRILIWLIILISTCLTACGRNDAIVVSKVPSEFTSLNEVNDSMKGVFRYVFWESVISFLDSDDVSIYQTGVKNSNFIVKYKDEYYVNKEKLLEIAEIAAISPEQRCKVYSFEDTVEIRGAGETVYYFQITALEAIKTEEVTTYTIKYAVNSTVDGDEQRRFITSVDTIDRVKYNTFDYIDAETVSIKIGKNRILGAIILTSPDYPGLSYRIAVDK